MAILISWIVSALAIIASAYILPGVHVAGFTTALVLALVLGIINAVIKPVLVILTLPINVITLGLFTLVINALLILLATLIVPGFKVDGFWWALIFGVVLSLINWFLNSLVK
jgi:putative membrane protein